ncbi:MAG: DUF4013 domain-containing protein [Methanomicrobiales archaeon]
MDIGEIVSDAIKYPSIEWKNVIILIVLFIIFWVLNALTGFVGYVVVPFIAGYIFRIVKWSLAGAEDLPEFDEWVDLFIDGLKVCLTYIVYMLPAIIILALTMGSMFIQLITMSQTGVVTPFTSLDTGLYVIGSIVTFLYVLIIGIPLFLMGIANMAYYDGDLGAAFSFSELLETFSSIGYVDFIIWYIVMIVMGFVASFIGGITIIGWIVTIPYYFMFGGRSLALLFLSQE